MRTVAVLHPPPRKSESLWLLAWRRLSRNHAAVIASTFLISLISVAVFADFITPYPPDLADFSAIRQPPSIEHVFGTDDIGRDIFSRIIYGARISLFVALTVQFSSAFIGIFIGMAAGYYGGVVDGILMRFVDIMYAMPQFLLAIFIISLLTPTVQSVIFTLVIIGWPLPARLVRGEVLSMKNREFVLASRSLGMQDWQIMQHHILPNILSPLIIQFTLGIVSVIMAEAALSFLGIGIRPPTPTWGGMINKGRDFIRSTPHLALYPSIVLALTAIAFNFLGDGLRDALDTRLKR